MKSFISLLTVLFLFSCVANTGDKAKNKKTDTEKPAGITDVKFDENIHDFGTLVSGEIVVTTFIFKNTGNHSFLIENIDSGCGCLNVKYPENPVLPGETGRVEVEFDSSGLFGKQYKSIEIYANCKEPKHLAIFATIKNDKLEIKY